MFAFGSYGDVPGHFDRPLDVAIVTPEIEGATDGELAFWLAVADYGNRRVQVFDLDGSYVDTVDFYPATAPCRLTWRAPVLGVEGIDGAPSRVTLRAARQHGAGCHTDIARQRERTRLVRERPEAAW